MDPSDDASGGDAPGAVGLIGTKSPPCQSSSQHATVDGLDLSMAPGQSQIRDRPARRRERLYNSESQLKFGTELSSPEGGETKTKSSTNTLRRRTKSLYGACQNFNFGPKATLLQTSYIIEIIQDPCKLMLMWKKKPQSVLIIKKIWDDMVDEAFVELAAWLVQVKKMEVLIEQQVMEDRIINKQPAFSSICSKLSTFTEGKDNLTDRVDLIICLGGDGTLLYASTLFQTSVPPIITFHLGSLGFLTSFDFSDYKEQVSQILEGSKTCFTLRTRLKCDILNKNGTSQLEAPPKTAGSRRHVLVLNEIVVDRGDASYLCQLDLFIEDKQITVLQGDGLIISTPTGSTAYAAAAGASMVHPNVPAIIIAPICPHSLSFRPIVVPADVKIKIAVSPDARSDAWVSFDGRNRQQLLKTDVLVISTSKYPLPSICSIDPINDWFESLAGCLHWNVRKIQAPLRYSSSPDVFIEGELSPDSNEDSSI